MLQEWKGKELYFHGHVQIMTNTCILFITTDSCLHWKKERVQFFDCSWERKRALKAKCSVEQLASFLFCSKRCKTHTSLNKNRWLNKAYPFLPL